MSSDVGRPRKHEEWTRDIILGDSEVHAILKEFDGSLAEAVALLLSRKDPTDIYDAVVSSQFDADRLDYLQRDRYMTGTQTGGFDFAWLLDCLEIGKINVGQAGEEYFQVDGLYLNHKGLVAVEGYLLARFHLYSQVYLHKTTRSAERMLAALLCRFAYLIKDGSGKATGLDERYALFRFFQQNKPALSSNLDLDDSAIWSGIAEITCGTDEIARSLAFGLRDRRLLQMRGHRS